jgi:hypothetical protein
MMRILLGAVGALAFAVFPAAAQVKPSIVRGTIEQVDGPVLTVKARSGETLKVKLLDARINAVVKASLSDIKPGDFVGATALPQDGGGWKAAEVHIFPSSMRGTGEGDRAYDYQPKSTMTNGTVSTMGSGAARGGPSAMGGSVAKVNGTALTINYKGNEKTVDVTPDTKVVSLVAGSNDDLKPGAQVVIPSPTKQADGSWAAARITVGRGIAPPM